MKKDLYILAPALIGLLFLLWLSSCARLTYDDLSFAATFKTRSFTEAFASLASTHTFRWTTLLVQYLVFGLVDGANYPFTLFLFFALFYILWIQQLGLLARVLLHKYLGVELERPTSWGLACLAILALYFFTSQAVEVFTFLGAVTDRLLPFMLMTWACNLLLSERSTWKLPLLVLCAFLLAGTGENGTLSVLLACFIYALFRKFKSRKKLPVAFLSFSASLTIFFALENLSAGNAERLWVEKVFHFTCGVNGGYCAETLPDLAWSLFNPRMLLAFPLLAVFGVFASGLAAEARAKLSRASADVLRFCAILVLPVLVAHVGAALWVFGSYGPMRMWMPVNGLFAIAGLSAALWLGTKFNALWFKWGAGVLACAAALFYFGRHFSVTNAYARAYDARVAHLRSLPVKDSVVMVPALPAPGLAAGADIFPNEHDDVNRDFRNAYEVPFNVRRID